MRIGSGCTGTRGSQRATLGEGRVECATQEAGQQLSLKIRRGGRERGWERREAPLAASAPVAAAAMRVRVALDVPTAMASSSAPSEEDGRSPILLLAGRSPPRLRVVVDGVDPEADTLQTLAAKAFVAHAGGRADPDAAHALRSVRGRCGGCASASLQHLLSVAPTEAGADPEVELYVPLRGGGGDGGSTGAEDRRAWLEMFAERKPEAADPREVRLARWTRCALSGTPLAPPCVVDLALGRVYNKEAFLRALLQRKAKRGRTEAGAGGLPHIRGMKDVREVSLSPASASSAGPPFSCPITGLEMNGRARFVAILPPGSAPGTVVSRTALREAPQAVRDLLGVASSSSGGEGSRDEGQHAGERGFLGGFDTVEVNPAGDALEAAMARARDQARGYEAKERAKKKRRMAEKGGELGGQSSDLV